jgi:hypothetical protein
MLTANWMGDLGSSSSDEAERGRLACVALSVIAS